MNKTLISLVKKEAAKLREFATQEELNELDFNLLNASRTDRCVYGLMTGDCYTTRAYDLIRQCAERVYRPGDLGGVDINDKLNGAPEIITTHSKNRAYYYHSPIEVFIFTNQKCNKHHNNKILIDYLKGERKTLKFIW